MEEGVWTTVVLPEMIDGTRLNFLSNKIKSSTKYLDSQEFQKPQFLYASFRVSNIWQTKLLHGTSIERTLPEKHPHLKLPIESGDVRAAVARTYKSSALKGRPTVAFFISPLNGIQETPQKWPSKRIWPFRTGPTWRADVLWGSDTGSAIGILRVFCSNWCWETCCWCCFFSKCVILLLLLHFKEFPGIFLSKSIIRYSNKWDFMFHD